MKKTLAILVAASLVSGAALATEGTTAAPAAATTATTPATDKAAPATTTEVKAEGDKATDTKKKKKKKNKKAEKATTSSSATVSAKGTVVAANAKPSPTASELAALTPVSPAAPAATTTTTVAATAPKAAKKVSAAISLNIGDSLKNVTSNELKGSLNSTFNFAQIGYKINPKLIVGYRQLFTMNGNTEVAGVKNHQVIQAEDGFVSLTKIGGPLLGSADNTINGLRVYAPISEASKTKKVDTKISYVGSADWEINSKLSFNVAPLITMTWANKRASSLSAVAQATLGYAHSDTVSSYAALIPQYSYLLPDSDVRKATMSKEAQMIELGASFAVAKNVELNPLVDIPVTGKLSTTGSTLQLAKDEDTWVGLVGTARF